MTKLTSCVAKHRAAADRRSGWSRNGGDSGTPPKVASRSSADKPLFGHKTQSALIKLLVTDFAYLGTRPLDAMAVRFSAAALDHSLVGEGADLVRAQP